MTKATRSGERCAHSSTRSKIQPGVSASIMLGPEISVRNGTRHSSTARQLLRQASEDVNLLAIQTSSSSEKPVLCLLVVFRGELPSPSGRGRILVPQVGKGNCKLAKIAKEGKHFPNENRSFAQHFKHFYDVRLVRAPQIPELAAMDCHRGELVDCLRGVLLSGAGEPHRLVSVFHGAIENHSRGDHAGGVLRVLGDVSPRAVSVELRRGFLLHRRRRVLHVL